MTTDVEPYFVAKGPHSSRADGMCAMEWVSYLAGEAHSDSPKCVSPLLAGFCVRLNDALPDDERQKLRPYLARTIGTRDDGLDEHRAWLCTDWLVRTYAPAWLSAAGLDSAAKRLRALSPMLTVESVQQAVDDLGCVTSEAETHAQATRSRAVFAAAGAAGVAWVAARDATRTLAGEYAVWVVGTVVGAPVLARRFQRSAFDLLDRMLPTESIRLLPVMEGADAICAVGALGP